MIQIACLLILCWQKWFALFADSIKMVYRDKRTGYGKLDEHYFDKSNEEG